MSDPLNERLNKILPRIISDDFLSGSGIGNEIAFYIFDYPPEDELRVRDYLRTLLDHIPKQKHGLRVKHIDLFEFVLDYLKSQLTFKNCGMTFKQFKDSEDFVKNYPFAPYQFQLVQRIFEAIRKAGATGMHLARGERSMLDAFQLAAKTVSINEVGVLVPLYDFYPAIESFLDTSVKKTIDHAFQLNRLEMEKDGQAGPALKRMQAILSARSPYGLIKEADALINTVNAVNSSILTGRRTQAIAKIDALIGTLNKDIAAAQGEASLRAVCIKPLETLKEQVQKEESLAHITQAEGEVVKEFDTAVTKIENHETHETYEKKKSGVKRQKIIEPVKLAGQTYLETIEDVQAFLHRLREELEAAIERGERIIIR